MDTLTQYIKKKTEMKKDALEDEDKAEVEEKNVTSGKRLRKKAWKSGSNSSKSENLVYQNNSKDKNFVKREKTSAAFVGHEEQQVSSKTKNGKTSVKCEQVKEKSVVVIR